MPVVIACPTCHQKARVPESMLGHSVKCPACAATFTVPADAPTDTPGITEATPPRPLPAEPDALRAVRAGAGVQIIAISLQAAGIGLLLFVSLLGLADKIALSGGRGGMAVAAIVTGVAALLLIASGLVGIVAASISVLAPPVHLARGLAIAVLILTVLACERLTSTFGWFAGLYDDMGGRWAPVARFVMSSLALAWLFEVARLAVLALFWRAALRIVRDNRGSTAAWRLAIIGPVIQVLFVAMWLMLAVLAGLAQELTLLAIAGWLALQLIIVLFAVGIAARVRRRIGALLPAGT